MKPWAATKNVSGLGVGLVEQLEKHKYLALLTLYGREREEDGNGAVSRGDKEIEMEESRANYKR